MSVYALDAPERLDSGHALGLIAATIGTAEFDDRARSAYEKKLNQQPQKGKPTEECGRKAATFIFPCSLLRPTEFAFTPHNNLEFTPADDRHYDVRLADNRRFAYIFLEGLRQRSVVYTFLQKPHYRIQAGVALATCIRRFKGLDDRCLKAWRDGQTLSAREQLERLRFIAGERGFQVRVQYNLQG